MLSLHPSTPPQASEVPSPPADSVPRNCLCLMPTIGGNSRRLLGYDADGNVWIDAEVRLDYWALEGLERLVNRESKQWQPVERRSALAMPTVRLVP